ncbi:unnamed protein product [Agarophyton chilense]
MLALGFAAPVARMSAEESATYAASAWEKLLTEYLTKVFSEGFIAFTSSPTLIGGPGGNGGNASAIGAIVTGGIGGPGISGDGKVVNDGIVVGGNGNFSGNVANGAAGNAFGGNITGTFTNVASAGNGGPGGAAKL